VYRDRRSINTCGAVRTGQNVKLLPPADRVAARRRMRHRRGDHRRAGDPGQVGRRGGQLSGQVRLHPIVPYNDGKARAVVGAVAAEIWRRLTP
jgi:hypothetical protein